MIGFVHTLMNRIEPTGDVFEFVLFNISGAVYANVQLSSLLFAFEAFPQVSATRAKGKATWNLLRSEKCD